MKELPNKPGCYLFKDKNDHVIYVGKAKNLKKRVSSYFGREHTGKTASLVTNIVSKDFFVTDNEDEALILEINLIKKYLPKYNINLKDSKKYAYLQVTDEEYPRLLLNRRAIGKGRFYGPFVSAAVRDVVREVLVKTFQIRTCRKLPKKPCLRYHIGLCLAPCVQKISKPEYMNNVKIVEQVLKGKNKEIIKKLDNKMKKASDKNNFEVALNLRDKISALEWLSKKQKMEKIKKYNQDVINYVINEEKVYLMLFNVHHGILENKQEFEFDNHGDFLEEFMAQYYSENDVPKEIILPKNISLGLLTFLSRHKKITIIVPKLGEKKQLLDLVKKNIEIQYFGDQEKLEDLKDKLRLNENPSVIECFDISHLSGTSTVGSMVQFRNGRPDKSNYRRFKIRTVEGIDDFAAIAEVVRRRYFRLKNEDQEFPNLIVIDGGKGQLNAAGFELQKLSLRIPIISIAKKFEEIYVPGLIRPRRLDRKSKALRYLQEIRDEAHRFAIKYNRLLRSKKGF